MKLVRESLVLEQKNKIQLSSGLAIIQQGSILLGHPKGQKWYGTYSIPKGQVEEGEDLLEAAIRETREEVGLTIDPEDVLFGDPNFIDYKDEKGNVYKKVYYFIVNPKDPIKQSAINPDKSEIDWAGFILKDAADARIFWRLKPILDHIEEIKDEEETRDELEKKSE
jgi:ADP-ribose pyrophosphatase YjhB (NUDIX family)